MLRFGDYLRSSKHQSALRSEYKNIKFILQVEITSLETLHAQTLFFSFFLQILQISTSPQAFVFIFPSIPISTLLRCFRCFSYGNMHYD